MKKKIKKRIHKKFNLSLFNVVVLVTTLIAAGILLHDFLVWGIIPMFSKEYIQLTYLGMFEDLLAIFALEINIQIMKEW